MPHDSANPSDHHESGVFPMVGAEVVRARIDGSTGTLFLRLREAPHDPLRELRIPPPWTFSSCLTSVASSGIDRTGEGQRPADELLGLEGARLSELRRDRNGRDLVFHSITISIPTPELTG